MKNKKINSTVFIAIMALYFGFILNAPIIKALYELSANSSSQTFVYTAPILLSSAFFIIFSLFNIPYLRKPFFIVLILTSTTLSYAILKYKIVFNYEMFINIIETNSAEASSYLNIYSALFTFVFGVIPSIWVAKLDFKSRKFKTYLFQNILGLLIAALAIVSIYKTSYKDYVSVGRNNRYIRGYIVPAHVYQLAKHVKKLYFSEPIPYVQQGLDATFIEPTNNKPNLVVFVLGETARAKNYPEYGYLRNTTPHTDNLKMISVKNVQTCGTATATSVPCMFSSLKRSNYSLGRAANQDNVIDIIDRAGIASLWVENDGGDKDVAKSITKIDIDVSNNKFCDGSTCQDLIFPANLDNYLNQLNKTAPNKNKLIVMHIIGSHGPTYYKRYPQDKTLFSPACERSDIENCSDIEITNVYDNSIAYTDLVLKQLVLGLKKQSSNYNTALTYISDHGESLGENGIYLHGTPYAFAPDEQTHVPWMFWLSPEYISANKINIAQFTQYITTNNFSQDNIFATLLDMLNVKTNVLNIKDSLFYQSKDL